MSEALRLVRGASGRYPDKIGLLKELAQLGSSNPLKLNLVRSGLEIASRSSPDDDRVWLGWANLATRTGEFAEAAQWLDRCERRTARRRRRSSGASWKPRPWPRRTRKGPGGRPRPTSARLGTSEPAEVLTLRLRLVRRRLSGGEQAEERRALGHELLAIEPVNLKSLERLAELELRAGRPEESAKLRARKAELDRAKAQYEIVLFLPDASLRTAQLARFADALDRRLESRILWTMAVRTSCPATPKPPQAPGPAREGVDARPLRPMRRCPPCSPGGPICKASSRAESRPLRRASPRRCSLTTPTRPGSGSPSITGLIRSVNSPRR